MLSGIRTGKKKKKRKAIDEPAGKVPAAVDKLQVASKKRLVTASSLDNVSVAEMLRRDLASSVSVPSPAVAAPPKSSATTESKEDLLLPFDRLERQGRIETAGNNNNDNDTNVVALTAAAGTSSRPDYRPEDFRTGSRKGKVKVRAVDVAGTTQAEAEMSIQDMIRQERENDRSMDEVYARNVARVGSRYKGTDFARSATTTMTGADEEDAVDMTMFSEQKLTKVAAQHRERSRQLSQHDRERSITAKCWWWMESSSFRKHRMIALGNHVSLVMTPGHLSLVPGEHLYLVPIRHAEALVGCEDDVWNEMYRFQSSLRAMYDKEGKVVVFCETVLPSSKGLWQTRMDCIPVPKSYAANIPMYFKSALTELAEEWGTHTKLLSTRDKGLRRTIPKKFPYFFVEWEENAGFAQIIENASFPKDLGADTLAGMMQMDPIRFRRRQPQQSAEEERNLVLKFLSKWKPFDWTLELDTSTC